MRKIDPLGIVLLALLAGLAAGAAYTALHFRWFESPWELAGLLVAGVAFVLAARGVERHYTTRNTNVHGAARLASESEAQAAARGDNKLPLHDRTFPD